MKKLVILAILIATVNGLYYKHNLAKYSIDLPGDWSSNVELYPAIIDFKSDREDVTLHIYTFNEEKYKTLESLKNAFVSKLKLKGKPLYQKYYDYQCAVIFSPITISNDTFNIGLYAFYKENGYSYVILTMSDNNIDAAVKATIYSAIDSFIPTEKYKTLPGFITLVEIDRAIENEYPKMKTTINLDEHYFKSTFTTEQNNGLKKLIEREINILTHTVGSIAAMNRFYKLIYRNSYSFFSPLSKELEEYQNKKNMTKEEMFFFLYISLYDYDTELLNGADIIRSPIEVLINKKGDCDSKTLTLQILLDQLNIGNEMLLSLKEGHCAIGIDSHFFTVPKKIFKIGLDNNPLVFFELMKPHPKYPRTTPWDPRLWKAVDNRYSD